MDAVCWLLPHRRGARSVASRKRPEGCGEEADSLRGYVAFSRRRLSGGLSDDCSHLQGDHPIEKTLEGNREDAEASLVSAPRLKRI